MSHQSPVRTELPVLDGLRAFAALYVTLHHCLIQVGFIESQLAGGLQRLAALFSYGHYAVDLFIVLSGFCLSLPFARLNFSSPVAFRTFLWKRVRRILPPYYAACLLCLLLSCTVLGPGPVSQWSKTLNVTGANYWTHALLIQDVFTSSAMKINYVLWSISVEWRIYLFFPLLIALWARLGGFMAAASAGLFSLIVALSLVSVQSHWLDLNLGVSGICPHYFLLFSLGILAADIATSQTPCARRFRCLPWGILMLCTGALLFLAPKLRILTGMPVPWEVLDVLVGLLCVCVLVICTSPSISGWSTWLRRVFSWKPLVGLGAFAYSIYLIHAPALELVWRYLLPQDLPLPTRALIFTGLSVPATLLLSYAFYLCAERPFLNSKGRSQRQTAVPAPCPASEAQPAVPRQDMP